MIIKAFNTLNENAIKEVLNLENICRKHDNLYGNVFLDTSDNFNHKIKSVFFLYEDNELISVLSMLIPTQQEAEISAFTLPEYRSCGYFKKLLSKAVQELRKFNVKDILFVCERQSISGKMAIASLSAHYAFTEYLMRFNKERYIPGNRCGLLLIKPKLDDFEMVINISMRIFNDSYEDAKSRINDCLESNYREQYLAILKDEIIGLCSINLEEDEVSIYGLGIVPEYRRKGYGKDLLQVIVDCMMQRGKSKITLMVNGDNTPAIELYKKFGFENAATFEYYRRRVGV